MLGLLAVTDVRSAPTNVTPAAAAPNWYDVEIIVFRNLDPAAGTLETWPTDPGLPDWTPATALNPPDSTGTPIPYQQLAPVGEQLDDDWTRLKRSHGYEPLLHLTWTQPALDRTNAPAVRVGTPVSLVPPSATAPAAIPAAAPGNGSTQQPPVYGTAKLSTTGPYLHFDLDLVLKGASAKTTMAA
ncbi:MAG TPA: CsiV family protein, partial [Gammaproteobacteria bacterium]|nr:CsiV family protein [Gammaproteobacteria bacterium]